MARRTGAEVDVPTEGEETAVESTTEETTTEAKAPKEPARGELPEGYVTPIGLAKELTARGLHTNREGTVTEVKPQMVYSYIKNAPKDHPFPLETIKDSLDKDRQALKLEDGVAWWEAKNERAATRKANAAQKAATKAANAEKKAAEATAVEAEGEPADATEAE